MDNNHVLLYCPPHFPPGGRDTERSQSCYQCCSKLENLCTEYVQFVASQFAFSRTGEIPVSGSGRVSVTSAAFCRCPEVGPRRSGARMAFACGGLRTVCVCPWPSPATLVCCGPSAAGPSHTEGSRESPNSLSLESTGVLKLQFILCPQAVILILAFYNRC